MSKDKFDFMREKDINIVKENVNVIIEKAHNKEIQIIEPVLEEFKSVKSVILNFIKKEKRIIYGGYAWNALISKVSPKDAFYKETDYTDVEFYSNKPIEDMKKLCDILDSKGFKYIQGKSAQHEDTYTIFVNFTGYCDITYVPSNIFYSMMTETINGFKFVHPKFVMVDILRQYNDPIISYRRLDKNIIRGQLMMKYYPFELSTNIIEMPTLSTEATQLVDYIIPNLVKSKSILFIGKIALNAFATPNKNISEQTTTYSNNVIELISTNLSKDVSVLYNIILKYFIENKKSEEFNDKILLEQYYPFFQFTDKKAVFKYNGSPFLIIYGNNEKCIPFININFSFKNNNYEIKIGTFNVVFMFELIKYHYAYINNDKHNQNLQDYIMYKLIEYRNSFLEENKKTILDETIFEDFKVDCFGTPMSPVRKYMLSRRDRKLMPKSSIYPYDPKEQKYNYQTESYYFSNYSGNIINNPRDLIFNPKKD